MMDKEEKREEDTQYGGGDCRVLDAETWDLCRTDTQEREYALGMLGMSENKTQPRSLREVWPAWKGVLFLSMTVLCLTFHPP